MSKNTKYHQLGFLTLVNTTYQYFNMRYILIISILFLITPINHSEAQQVLNKIVIDAGHGGKDPGASGKYSREKDVVLAIALKTGTFIKQMHPDVEIIYTRKSDIFIPLKERAEIANRSNADLFISIHCNANRSSQPQGSETYVMGLHKSEANLNVAKTENAAILFEDDYEETYDGFDPTSEESHIIFNFFQNSFLAQNLDLASKMQHKFTAQTPLKDRGVKQAGFWVLYKTTMPGVLIETGFLSNPSDEKFLNSKNGQEKISKAIASAISEYKKNHDQKELEKAKHKFSDSIQEHEEKSVASTPKVMIHEDAKKEIKEDFSKKSKAQETKPSAQNTERIKTEIPKENQKEQVQFFVQFLSLSKDKKLIGAKYKSLEPIETYLHKGMYRYICFASSDYDSALKAQERVRNLGYKDAFLVAFYQGKRIGIEEARDLIDKK